MRIAQVSPLHERVPPQLYGGTERVVSYLTEELVRQGHDVTLFASGDSITSAKLIACCERALRLGNTCPEPMVPHLVMLEKVIARADQFDIIHFHTDLLHLPFARRLSTAHITTIHSRTDDPHLRPLYREYLELPLVSISDAQQKMLPWANWKATVHHGLPPELYRFNPQPQPYLAFVGRMAKEKRPDLAVEIAQRAGIELRMAAKVDAHDRLYFEQTIRPLLDLPGVEFVGEINDQQKNDFLGNALALLFPIDWPEPFGVVVIEAMACGTPVIAFRRGSIPEIIDEEVSGFIVDDLDAAVQAVQRIHSLSRQGCRERFEARFTASRMAQDYVNVYSRRARGVRLKDQAAVRSAGYG